jgi:hypothetical protein
MLPTGMRNPHLSRASMLSYRRIAASTVSQLYEALEPLLNGHRVSLLDGPVLEQQLLGLIWRGTKIDHQAGEHDDWSHAAAGALALVQARSR